MSLIFEKYDEDEKKEYSWYDSSSVLYSVCSDPENGLKELIVVFNNGTAYLYKDVDVYDYLLFSRGGLDGSQGKSFYRFIRNKYQGEKLSNFDIEELKMKFKRWMNGQSKPHTYFISGHRDLTKEEFDKNYAPAIDFIIENDSGSMFVVGDYEGADILAQNYLIDVLNFNPKNITVYHIGDKPNNINPKITNFIGGFLTDEERDSAMTNASVKDIAFVRDNTKWSGTAQNILRRFLLKK